MLGQFVVKRYPRDSFLLATKMPYTVRRAEDYTSIFQRSLTECGVEFFDYYLLHCLSASNYELHRRLGGFEFVNRLKREDRAKHIGFSFHDKPELLDRILTEHPEMEFVQLQINYLDWDDPIIQSKQLYEVARRHEKPIFVMEPIKGGSLANLEKFDSDVQADMKTYAELALKFVASLDVQVVLSGMSALEHVLNNRRTFASKVELTEDDRKNYDKLRALAKEKIQIPCTNCKYCQSECPKHVAIPEILGVLNFCEYDGTPHRNFLNGGNRFKLYYDNHILNKGKASDCIQCGACEAQCPQKIPIRKHILAAKSMFEG